MLDGHGREIGYLRISVTDRCNLRCVYCMPADGISAVSHREILTYEELLRICRCAVRLGITRFKLTGGEPLVRRGITDFVGDLSNLKGVREVTMTSNGILLGEMAAPLRENGLSAINISLDTLDPAEFSQITRGGDLTKVTASIDRALEAGLSVKINCVPLRARGEEALSQVALLAKDRPLHVRFIELMPIGEGDPAQGFTAGEVRESLEKRFGAPEPWTGVLGNGPASYVSFPGFAGKIGLITAVSSHFCGACNRVRLTAPGFLKLCLHDDRGLDLRELLRSGIDDDGLTAALEKAILQKPERHRFGSGETAHMERHTMAQIGG